MRSRLGVVAAVSAVRLRQYLHQLASLIELTAMRLLLPLQAAPMNARQKLT